MHGFLDVLIVDAVWIETAQYAHKFCEYLESGEWACRMIHELFTGLVLEIPDTC